MKTKIILFALLAMCFFSCSSDDDKTNEVLSERVEFEIDEVSELSFESVAYIQVNIDKLIINPSKVFVEFNIEFSEAQNLEFGYKMPNSSDYKFIVAGLGASNKYVAYNVLRFSQNHSNIIENTYPNQIIPSGNYKEGSVNNNQYPVETPLFNSMLNQNAKGLWRFYFLSNYYLSSGKIHKIKLIFEEGALEL